MSTRKREAATIKAVIDQMISESRLKTGMTKMNIQDAWKDLMGPGVDNYTKRIELKNGRLLVQLSSSVLREELSYGKDKIVKMLNDELGSQVIKSLELY